MAGTGELATSATENPTSDGVATEGAGEQVVTAQQDGQPQEETFESLIAGKYKKEYEKSLKSAMQKRFKNQRDLQGKIDRIDPIIRTMAERYNIKPAADGSISIDDLHNAIMNDNAAYEQEAFQRGMNVEDLKQLDYTIESWLCLGNLIKTCIDAHDGREAECNAILGILEQLLDAIHLALAQESIAEEVWLELNGNFAHFLMLTYILLPYVLKVTADECKIVLSEDLDRIAYYTTSSRTILNEVQFYLLVFVERKCETLFISVNEIKTVFLFKRCYFGYDLVHG